MSSTPIRPFPACALAFACATLLAPAAPRAATPDAPAIARLDSLLSARDQVRVRTDSGTVTLLAPRAAPEGVFSSEVATARYTTVSSRPDLVPWPRVVAIEEPHYRGAWLAGGALAGAAVGFALGNTHPGDPNSSGPERATSTPLGLAAGLFAGYALMRARAVWREIFP